jgi:hypothetical protein
VADGFGRSSEGAHSDHHAENCGDNAETGERVGHGAQRTGRFSRAVVADFHVEFEHLVDGEGLGVVAHGEAQRVADEIAEVLLLQKFGIRLEYRALGGGLDVCFDRKHA